MGMSASQIRYCMLQARKNDIEYQGQQINQQRTTLATQSAAHNTELLTLTVPVPPSTEQYTTVNYSYTMNGNECTIKGLSYKQDGTYRVDYVTKDIQDRASQGATFSYKETDGKKTVVLNGKSYELKDIASDTDENKPIHNANKEIIQRDFNIDKTTDDDTYYYIELNNGTVAYAYFRSSELEDTTGTALKNVKDYVVSAQKVDVEGKIENAEVNWADTGRMASITETKEDGTKRTYTLTMDTVADNAAYESAYNEYLFQKDKYNKTMDEINAKLDIIQAQDKELELQLRNLDTQENAISTEMDAVKSVTDKNIEKSFNVFG